LQRSNLIIINQLELTSECISRINTIPHSEIKEADIQNIEYELNLKIKHD